MDNIPEEQDWGEYWKDIDQTSAFSNFFGKSNKQMQTHFFIDANELINEIRFMPVTVFNYYILGLQIFIESGNFPENEDAHIVSYFLDMIEFLLINEPEKISHRIIELMPTIEMVANNQNKYNADYITFGCFLEKLESIKKYTYSQ